MVCCHKKRSRDFCLVRVVGRVWKSSAKSAAICVICVWLYGCPPSSQAGLWTPQSPIYYSPPPSPSRDVAFRRYSGRRPRNRGPGGRPAEQAGPERPRDRACHQAGAHASVRDPLEDIKNSAEIKYVMKNGELFDGPTIDRVWPTAEKCPVPAWIKERADLESLRKQH